MRSVFFQFFFFIILKVTYSQNLVPNPSFEFFSQCPTNWGYGNYLTNWIKLGSLENFNNCGEGNFSTPANIIGYQFPFQGNGYCGFGCYNKGGTVVLEFLEAELINELQGGETYQIEFNVSLADSVYFAINSICLFLSETEIASTPQAINNLINVQPQICSQGFITDKEQWTKISKRYTALGNEKFLVIGNFKTSDQTDTINVGGGILITPPTNFNMISYYYIDDVSVTLADSLNEIDENEFIPFTLYPNPAENQVSIQSTSPKQLSYSVSNKLGQQVLQGSFTKETRIETSALTTGIYFVEVGGKREKLVVCR